VSAIDLHHAVDGPEGAPVVVLTGSLGSTLAMWQPQVAALSERFRVVRYDTRGHGSSPVPLRPYTLDDLVDDHVALLDALEVERASVVGLSLGGMIALRLASREPHRVERVAALCTSALLAPAQAWRIVRRRSAPRPPPRSLTQCCSGGSPRSSPLRSPRSSPGCARWCPARRRRVTPPAARSSPTWICVRTCGRSTRRCSRWPEPTTRRRRPSTSRRSPRACPTVASTSETRFWSTTLPG
jgi:pimeloyl-ACP methyl ester carboxylesterase